VLLVQKISPKEKNVKVLNQQGHMMKNWAQIEQIEGLYSMLV